MEKHSYHVIAREDGSWAVKAENAGRASSVHSTQSDAVRSARSLAKRSRGNLLVHGSDGRIREIRHYAEDSETAKSSRAQTNPSPDKREKTAVPAIYLRIGHRLRRARVMTGYSLRGLADAIGNEVSHTMIQKIEAGETCPDSKLLARLGQVMEVRPDYFFKHNDLKLATVEYRSQTKLGAKARERLEEQAYEFFERYLEIEHILGLPMSVFPIADLSATAEEDLSSAIEDAAESLRETWELGMNPIPNVHGMLEKHGVKVRVLPHEDGFDGFSAFAEGDDHRVPVIALSERWLRGPDRDLPRFRFTAIHELAHLHLILPDHLSHKQKESYCHRFSGAFMVPRKPFEDAFGVNRVKIALTELCAIKSEWGISIGAIMKRAANLGLISPGRYKTYCIVAAKNGWRTKDPGSWIGNEESSRFEPLVVRALAQELITTSKAAGLLGVSLPELGRKFEPIE
jgi:Zn-dependent peptidase ImmA (M78 family)/ribosome-binding protein aMBF1 (putative translation factor)